MTGGRLRTPGVALLVLVAYLFSACDGAAPQGGRTEGTGSTAANVDANANRTLIIAVRTEPKSLTGVDLNPVHVGIAPDAPWQLFHGGLTQHDEKDVPHLQLAESLPTLGTDSWKVFPDGRMETTWRLKPNLTWHDGTTVTADDFVLGVQFSKGTRSDRLPEVDEILAPDARTILVRYKSPSPIAGESDWQPLPRHIIGQTLEQMDPREAFATLPFWTTDFVGVGPYRLTGWESGASMSGEAFAGYVHGKPKIGRIQILFVADANTAVATLLAGSIHLATDLAVTFEQGQVLRQEWPSRGQSGSVLLATARTVYVQLQFRPEYMRPLTMQDVRMRRALAHAIDKQAIVDAVLGGEPATADTLVAKEEEYYPELASILTKYPLDLRRTDELLADLGYTKDGEGFYGLGGNRLSIGLIPLGDYLREALILADGWKRAGIDVGLQTLSPAEQTDQRVASVFPTTIITQFGINPNPFLPWTAGTIASEATRWAGRNKGAYYDPQMDRLYEVYSTSLERRDRNRAVMQAMQLIADQAAYYPLYYAYEVMAHTGGFVGPRTGKRAASMLKVEEWNWK